MMNSIQFPVDLDMRIKNAIEYFWNTRNGQIKRQNLMVYEIKEIEELSQVANSWMVLLI